jgi:hypothetical protein
MLLLNDRDQPSTSPSARRIAGVAVNYDFDPAIFFPTSWNTHDTCRGEPLDFDTVSHIIPVVKRFTAAYSQDILRRNLSNIYLLGRLVCGGHDYGGTYTGRSVYVVSRALDDGFSDAFVYSVLHAEFSSILMHNYPFPAQEWAAINEPSFIYSDNAPQMVDQPEMYDRSDALFSGGFLRLYATTSLENDFNELAEWLFDQSDELCGYRRQYARVEQKAALAIRFYQSVDPAMSFPTCV